MVQMMVDFLHSERDVTVLNGRSVSSNETEARNGTKSWKAHPFSSAERSEANGGLQISNK
jgi:hypothetical protein